MTITAKQAELIRQALTEGTRITSYFDMDGAHTMFMIDGIAVDFHPNRALGGAIIDAHYAGVLTNTDGVITLRDNS